ncbi:hypothetical protein H2248_012495 [Termitomyces sp. 'cryptogamus']|nr:hypothetical protein H2248_012495 [Termitomyces sp. 'cryptogamus']
MNGNGVVQCSTPQRRKYLFFSSSTVIPVSPGINSSSRSVLRDVFIRHKASASSPNVNVTPVDRHFPFAFQLPRSCWPGEQMPPSFTSSQVSGSMSNVFDVSYRIKVVWEATNAIDVPFVLKVPILFYPDHDPRSVVASSENPQSWLEMPLNSDRPMPFRCAVTLPTLVTFPRPSSIPYFVVFTTVPRSPALAREVAADATITVSLVRQVNVTEQVESLSTLPTIPMSASLKSDILRNKLLKRIGRDGQSPVRAMKILEKTPDLQDKPLPPLPNRTFTETTLLQNSMNIGFPKRPRLRFDGRSHPSLEDYAALPDGLYKNKILVSEDVLPSIDCAGLNVKFYLDVSVLVGLDDFRARIPVCLM